MLTDAWAYGPALIPARYQVRGIGWTDVGAAQRPGNPYAHPVNGLHPVVDLNTMKLLSSRTATRMTGPRT